MEASMSAIISVLIGVSSTLLTIFLTPRLQHYFWGYQRMGELRLAALREVNNLAAEFLFNYIKDSNYHPTDQFFMSWMITTTSIKALFSQTAFDRFKELDNMIGPGLGPTGKGSTEAFIKARDAGLRALYDEAVAAKWFYKNAASKSQA
jgi:hypothetical protein